MKYDFNFIRVNLPDGGIYYMARKDSFPRNPTEFMKTNIRALEVEGNDRPINLACKKYESRGCIIDILATELSKSQVNSMKLNAIKLARLDPTLTVYNTI